MSFAHSLAQRLRSVIPSRRHLILVLGTLLALMILVIATSRRPMVHDLSVIKSSMQSAPVSPTAQGTLFPALIDQTVEEAKEREPGDRDLRSQMTTSFDRPFSGPAETHAITYSAELSIASKDFAHARSAMEEVLDRHDGYTARLRMTGVVAGSTLSATLRVPVSEYASALAELKSIGTVERDEEAADEIAQQHGDIAARLKNAQNAERRLEQLLKDNDGKASPFFIQQQLIQVRAEIARLEAEQRAFDSRVALSNIYVTIHEERVTPAESFAGQLRAAALAGFSDVLGTLSAIILFAVNYGPSLLLWAALLFVPFRFLWRRSQAHLLRTTG